MDDDIHRLLFRAAALKCSQQFVHVFLAAVQGAILTEAREKRDARCIQLLDALRSNLSNARRLQTALSAGNFNDGVVAASPFPVIPAAAVIGCLMLGVVVPRSTDEVLAAASASSMTTAAQHFVAPVVPSEVSADPSWGSHSKGAASLESTGGSNNSRTISRMTPWLPSWIPSNWGVSDPRSRLTLQGDDIFDIATSLLQHATPAATQLVHVTARLSEMTQSCAGKQSGHGAETSARGLSGSAFLACLECACKAHCMWMQLAVCTSSACGPNGMPALVKCIARLSQTNATRCNSHTKATIDCKWELQAVVAKAQEQLLPAQRYQLCALMSARYWQLCPSNVRMHIYASALQTLPPASLARFQRNLHIAVSAKSSSVDQLWLFACIAWLPLPEALSAAVTQLCYLRNASHPLSTPTTLLSSTQTAVTGIPPPTCCTDGCCVLAAYLTATSSGVGSEVSASSATDSAALARSGTHGDPRSAGPHSEYSLIAAPPGSPIAGSTSRALTVASFQAPGTRQDGGAASFCVTVQSRTQSLPALHLLHSISPQLAWSLNFVQPSLSEGEEVPTDAEIGARYWRAVAKQAAAFVTGSSTSSSSSGGAKAVEVACVPSEFVTGTVRASHAAPFPCLEQPLCRVLQHATLAMRHATRELSREAFNHGLECVAPVVTSVLLASLSALKFLHVDDATLGVVADAISYLTLFLSRAVPHGIKKSLLLQVLACVHDSACIMQRAGSRTPAPAANSLRLVGELMAANVCNPGILHPMLAICTVLDPSPTFMTVILGVDAPVPSLAALSGSASSHSRAPSPRAETLEAWLMASIPWFARHVMSGASKAMVPLLQQVLQRLLPDDATDLPTGSWPLITVLVYHIDSALSSLVATTRESEHSPTGNNSRQLLRLDGAADTLVGLSAVPASAWACILAQASSALLHALARTATVLQALVKQIKLRDRSHPRPFPRELVSALSGLHQLLAPAEAAAAASTDVSLAPSRAIVPSPVVASGLKRARASLPAASRNSVVLKWQKEDRDRGDDYADLEDFIVE